MDDVVVGDAIHAVGRCARIIPSCMPQCLSALMNMIKSRHGMSLICHAVIPTKHPPDIVVSNAVLVLKALIQNQLLAGSAPAPSQSPLTIISLLARRVDDIRHPQARACVLWLVGQYGAAPGIGTVIDGVADWAPDVLRKFAKSFSTEVCLRPRVSCSYSKTPPGTFGQTSSSDSCCQTLLVVPNRPEAGSTLSPRVVSW